MNYYEKLAARISAIGSNLCVGLDVRETSVDEAYWRIKDVISATAPYAAAFKPNSAYFESFGWRGMEVLEKLRRYIPEEIPMILDVKRGDIGETQKYYAKAAFDVIGADAVTLNPYMGFDSIEPFLEWKDKGVYLLGITSNKGAEDIQLRALDYYRDNGNMLVCSIVTDMSLKHDLGLVAGLTNMQRVDVPDVPLLIPGLGAQGGDMKDFDRANRKAPCLVNVSRGILYDEPEKSFAEKAEYWRNIIRGEVV